MPKRIAFVSPTGNVSGAEVVLINALAAAAARGLSVRCICPPGDLVARLPEGVTWQELPEQALPPIPKPLAAIGLGARAIAGGRALAQHCADVDAVVVNGFLALPAVRAARLSAPVTWVTHDVLRRRDWFAVLALVKDAVRQVIAVSHAAARPLVERGMSVTVVPNGVAWPVAPRESEPDTPIVGCVALLTPWKGHEALLDAFAEVRTPGARLQLVGAPFPNDVQYAEQLRIRATRPDLAGRVEFLGRQSDPLAIMRGWTMAVSPSKEPEAMPLVVLEALSVGLPMVATAIGGSLEILGNGGGFLVPPNDHASLARAIDAMLADAAERARLHVWGRDQIAGHYQREVQLQALIDAVAGGPW